MITERELRRRLLLKRTNQVLEALLEKKPESLPVTDDLKVSYNGVLAGLGDNEIWKHTLRIPQRQAFPDPDTDNCVFIGVCTNEVMTLPGYNFDDFVHAWFYALRIRLRGELICEIEEISCHSRAMGFETEAEDVSLPIVLFDTPIPMEERSTREELIETVNAYWNGVEKSISWDQVPVHPGARRCEMGHFTTDCKLTPASLQSNFKIPEFCWSIKHRRFPVVDVARGVVASYVSFYPAEGEIMSKGNGSGTMELFKVEGGMLRALYAHFALNAPLKSVWTDEE